MPKPLRIVLVLAVAIGAATAWWMTHRESKDVDRLKLSGTIEVTQVDLAFKIPGRLLERLVDEGDPVTAGQVVARLDPVDQQLQVARAEAEADAANAFLAKLESGSRPEEVAEARARLQQARAAERSAESRLKLAGEELARHRDMWAHKVISRQQLDERQTVYDTAFHTRQEAAARRRSARAHLDLVLAGPRLEDIQQAQAQVNVTAQALAMVRQHLTDAALTAPVDGVVLSKAAEPGTFLNAGTPVLTVGEMGRVWVRGYINETDLGRVRLNQAAEVTTDTYPGKVYHGMIRFISDLAEFTPKAVQTYQERVKLMYRIKIYLENPNQELKPGMPVDAVISTR